MSTIASIYGGSVPAELQPGTRPLVPLRATYRARLGDCVGATVLARQMVGTAAIGDSRESFV